MPACCGRGDGGRTSGGSGRRAAAAGCGGGRCRRPSPAASGTRAALCSQLTSGADHATRAVEPVNVGHQRSGPSGRGRSCVIEAAGTRPSAWPRRRCSGIPTCTPCTSGTGRAPRGPSSLRRRLQLAARRASAQPQGVGPAARAVLLVARRPERRAHRPALQLAADARAVAHLDRRGRSPPACCSRRASAGSAGLIARAVAQVLGHRPAHRRSCRG